MRKQKHLRFQWEHFRKVNPLSPEGQKKEGRMRQDACQHITTSDVPLKIMIYKKLVNEDTTREYVTKPANVGVVDEERKYVFLETV